MIKFKWVFLLFFIAIVVSGIYAYNSNTSADSSSQIADSSGQVILSSPEAEAQAEYSDTVIDKLSDSRSKSNLLLSRDSNRAGFSIITILRGLLGMLVLVAISWLFSSNRKAISWKVVATGLSLQVLLALGVLYIPFIQTFFEIAGKLFVKILDFTQAGVNFLFASMVSGKIEMGLINFVVKILPTIIFFSALTSLLFYLGIIQKIVFGLAWVMSKLMKLSGAESLSLAGNIFLGQTESPLMIKEYLPKMNKSEMLLAPFSQSG